MKIFCSILLMLTFLFSSTAQSFINNIGAYSKDYPDAKSFTANQAALAQINKTSVALYGERKFLLSEITGISLTGAMPTNTGPFGFELQYEGFALYNQLKAGIAYARNLGTKISVGTQFNYRAIHIAEDYGTASSIQAELGIICHVSTQLHAGVHAGNVASSKFGNDEKWPATYSFGLGYDVSSIFFISAELIKEENKPIDLQAGFIYHPVPKVSVSFGIKSATPLYGLQIGWDMHFGMIAISMQYHPQLGYTPGLLLMFTGKNRTNKKLDE